jgi:predicted HAD superfamily hydrolase
MTHQTFFSIPTLIRAADKRLPGVDVVSFDLFDTLLVRRTHDPDLVKVPVARFISSLAQNRGIDMAWQQVQERRDEIEQAQRQQTGKDFEDLEAHYPTFMAQTLDSIFGHQEDNQLLEQVTAFELKIENAMLVPRQEIVEWLGTIADQGKRILVISDIYLPANHLEVLLEHAGILAQIEKVISSADSFLAKASGKGYQLVQEQFGLSPSKWMHVGDNPISDGLRADAFGIQAMVLQDPEEHRRKAIAARYYFCNRSRAFWKGRALQQLVAPLEAENIGRSALYTEGYNFIGPLIGIFVQSVAEHCRENGITKIFFLSREGWMFKQVWEKITPYLFPDQQLPEIEYLYVSRLSLAGPGCAYQGMTPDNARIVFLPPGNKNFSDVCRIFNLDPVPLEPHLKRNKLTLETTLSPLHSGFDPEHSWNFEKLLKDEEFQAEVKSQAAPSSMALQQYLESVGFFDHKDVALVDIGWLGTIQRFFYDAIKHRADRPNCHGLLFGATRGIPFNTTTDNHIRGLIYDRERFDFAASAIMYARDIFEEASRAPHPTTIGYRINEKGEAEPVFRDMSDQLGKSEQEQDTHYSDLQKGILASAERFGAASTIIANNTKGFRPWVNYLLVSKLAFARSTEVRSLRYKHHLDDFHGVNKPKIFRMPKMFHNPWESKGWRFYLGCLFPGRVFRRHLKEMINR